MKWKTLCVCAFALCAYVPQAFAQAPQTIVPEKSNGVSEVTTEGPEYEYSEPIKVPAVSRSIERRSKRGTIYLDPGSTKVLHLATDAASVVVANPSHASVFLDSPRTAIVIPRSTGATSFTILDRDGNLITTKNVVITNTDENYVRIRRICGGDATCVDTTVYYCDDNCVEVSSNGAGQAQ